MSDVKHKYLPNYTYDDYKNWEGKWELINGIPYAMSPAPGMIHQEVSANISYQLKDLFKNCKSCKSFLPIDWRIPGGDDNNVYQPDNLVICKKVAGDYITEAPVMIFEIISPSSSYKDRHVKYEVYETNGVKYYIIVDPEKNCADVFKLENNTYKKIAEAKDENIEFDLEDDCSIEFNFEKIWN